MARVYKRRFLKGTMVYDQRANGPDSEKIDVNEIAEPATPEQEAKVTEAIRRMRRGDVRFYTK